jgi:hypothetical protein
MTLKAARKCQSIERKGKDDDEQVHRTFMWLH